jgi:endonuclease-3
MDWYHVIETMERIGRERKAPVYSFNLKSPFEVLVSAVLSTRTRDEQTIKAIKNLFSVVKTPKDLLKLSVDEIDELIKSVGFHRVKAENLKRIAEIIVKEHDSRVPDNFEDLLKLPGVGRKVANVVLSNLGKNAIAVDTHVHRITNRLGFKTKDERETEKLLREIVPEELWKRLNKAFVGYGQTVCKPKNPLCDECPLSDICSFGKRFKTSKG